MDVRQRAALYISKIQSTEGNNGSGGCFHAACTLAEGFALPEEDVRSILSEWNLTTASPPWSQRELEHKISDAMKHANGPQRGCMLNSTSDERKTIYRPPSKIIPKQELSFSEFIKAAFIPGEHIAVANLVLNEDGVAIPDGGGHVFTYEYWLKRAAENNDSLDRWFGRKKEYGAYIRINPIAKNGSKDKDVTAYRHCLVEFDDSTVDEQWDKIKAAGMPVTAVVSSGGKSLHAWVRVDAKNIGEYYSKFDLLKTATSCDPKNRNPSRFARLPNVWRGDKRQSLLAFNLGAASWDKWKKPEVETRAEQENDYAEWSIEDCDEILNNPPAKPDELIEGVCYVDSKIYMTGPSKAKKTSFQIYTAACIGAGAPWFGFNTRQGQVLYINCELRKYSFWHRLKSIRDELGLTGKSNIRAMNLKGKTVSIEKLQSFLTNKITSGQYSLIIIDPLYKILGNRDENKAHEMAELMARIEAIAARAGSSILIAHHHAKGNMTGRTSIDRGSGSGVTARDGDVLIDLTPVPDTEMMAMEITVRDMPPIPKTALIFQYPLFHTREVELPESKQNVKRQSDVKYQRGLSTQDVLNVMSNEWMTREMIVAILRDKHNLGENRVRNYVKLALEDNRVKTRREERSGNKPIIYYST